MIYTNLDTDPTRDFTGRTWVFNEINDWLLKAEKPRYFLLTGEPGSGKTTIAARLCQFAMGEAVAPETLSGLIPGFLSATYFCFARDSRWIDPHHFVQSIALQLSKNQAYARALVNIGEKEIDMEVKQNIEKVEAGGVVQGIVINNLDVSGLKPQVAFNRAVRDPLEMIYAEGFDQPITILVDALDEALTHTGDVTIVDLLSKLEKLPAQVRFILTSREDDRVQNEFLEADGLLLSADVYDKQNRKDLYDYMAKRLKEDPALIKHTAALEPDQVQALEANIINKAAGNFLYVSFLLQAMVAGQRSLTELEGLPEGLDALYYQSLDRVVKLGDKKWAKDYAPLMAGLSVAYEGLTPVQLQGISGQSDLFFWEHVDHLRQFVEEIGSERNQNGSAIRYRLYHQSVTDFLRRPVLRLNGKQPRNRYYLPAEASHRQVVKHYLKMIPAWKAGDWKKCDPYALRYLVRHIYTLLAQAPPQEQKKLTDNLYKVVLNDEFRKAQRDQLGDLHAILSDIQLALDIASSQDDLPKMLACAAAYRDTLKRESLAQSIFEAVETGDFEQAFQRAEHYGVAPKPRARWVQVLQLYLAWEAAEAGQIEVAQQAVSDAGEWRSAQPRELCDALLVRIAQTIADKVGRKIKDCLAELAPGRDTQPWFEKHYQERSLAASDEAQLLSQLDDELHIIEQMVADGAAEFVSMEIYITEKERTTRANFLKDRLVKLSRHPLIRERIDRALTPVLNNPYPSYRDIALIVLGIGVVSVPDPIWWVRKSLRVILRTALDSEGVIFTFDLPSILAAEAERRGQSVPWELSNYLQQALSAEDDWGTAMRAYSARAAAQFWQGDRDQALETLREASGLRSGFAGYATVTLLSLANRCYEFGLPERALQPIWGSNRDVDLLGGAMGLAKNVRDLDFQKERITLVEMYQSWLGRDIPDIEAVEADLTILPAPDDRRVYKDFVTARWASVPNQPNLTGLKAMVPLVLADGAALDFVLGRLVGLRLKTLKDDELRQAMEICAASLTTGRPWELGQWQEWY